MTFSVLNIMVFYFEWRLALYLLGNWPLGIIGSIITQQVRMYVNLYMYVYVLIYVYISYPSFLYKLYMLNKNTPGIKKVRGQSEVALQIGMCDQKL